MAEHVRTVACALLILGLVGGVFGVFVGAGLVGVQLAALVERRRQKRGVMAPEEKPVADRIRDFRQRVAAVRNVLAMGPEAYRRTIYDADLALLDWLAEFHEGHAERPQPSRARRR
jgi:hypothetical protein